MQLCGRWTSNQISTEIHSTEFLDSALWGRSHEDDNNICCKNKFDN